MVNEGKGRLWKLASVSLKGGQRPSNVVGREKKTIPIREFYEPPFRLRRVSRNHTWQQREAPMIAFVGPLLSSDAY